MPAVNCRLFIFTILLSARSAQALEIESGLWRHLDSGTTRCMNSQTIADEVRHFADDIRFWNNGEVPQHEFTYHIGDRHAPNTATVRYAQPNRDGSPHTVELKISRPRPQTSRLYHHCKRRNQNKPLAIHRQTLSACPLTQFSASLQNRQNTDFQVTG